MTVLGHTGSLIGAGDTCLSGSVVLMLVSGRSGPFVECRSLSKHFVVKTYDVPASVGSMGYVASRKLLATVLNKTKTKLVKAVDEVDLEVDPGTWLGLLGPNGSGKTTLLKLISGLVSPTKGSVWVMGHDTVKESERVLDLVHFVPGLTTGCIWIDGTLTVRQNLGFIAGLYGFGKDEVDEAIHQVGLGEVCDQRTGTLSTGMTARMILALGLMRDASVYLFDEPVIGLDPLAIRSFSNMIKERIGERRGEGVVIYASHMLSEIERTCDQVAFLNQGRIIAKDSLESITRSIGPGRTVKAVIRPPDKAGGMVGNLESEGIPVLGLEEKPDSASIVVDVSDRDETEAAQAVFRVAGEGGIRILSLVLEEPSLEEVFTHLLGQRGHPGRREVEAWKG